MATDSSILAWKIPWTEEPGGPQAMGVTKASDTTQRLNNNHHKKRELAQTHTRTCAAAAAAKSLQSCPTLCDPRVSSPPGFPVPGILQARTLEWVAISFSNALK